MCRHLHGRSPPWTQSMGLSAHVHGANQLRIAKLSAWWVVYDESSLLQGTIPSVTHTFSPHFDLPVVSSRTGSEIPPWRHCNPLNHLATLGGFTPRAWDFIDRNFVEQVIHKDLLNPHLHGFFSYNNWRKEQTGCKRKHREWERKRMNKRQRTEASMSSQPPRISPEPPTPWISISSPELL